jgi:hypothetical protein
MNTIVIDIPPETYRRLQEEARAAGKAPEALTRELVETALGVGQPMRSSQTREALAASGRIRPLSPSLRQRIIPGVTLEEVRQALTQRAGPSLSEIILEQRGAKP